MDDSAKIVKLTEDLSRVLADNAILLEERDFLLDENEFLLGRVHELEKELGH